MSALLVLWLLVLVQAHKEPTVLRMYLRFCCGPLFAAAVLEAQYSRVPLIILSADRPSYTLHVGAPQTVDQHKIFGTAVNYYEELAVPQRGSLLYISTPSGS